MTAAAAPGPQPVPDASPRAIRAALLPEEVGDFEREWRAALAEAAETLDLTVVYETLECWRRIAWSTQTDPAGHRRMLETAKKALADEDIPTVPAQDVKALIRQRLGL